MLFQWQHRILTILDFTHDYTILAAPSQIQRTILWGHWKGNAVATHFRLCAGEFNDNLSLSKPIDVWFKGGGLYYGDSILDCIILWGHWKGNAVTTQFRLCAGEFNDNLSLSKPIDVWFNGSKLYYEDSILDCIIFVFQMMNLSWLLKVLMAQKRWQ